MNKELYKIKLINNPLRFNLALGRIILLNKNSSILRQVVRSLQIRKHGLIKYAITWVLEFIARALQFKGENIPWKHYFEGEVKAAFYDHEGRYKDYVNTHCILTYQQGTLSDINGAATLAHLDADIAGAISEDEIQKAVDKADEDEYMELTDAGAAILQTHPWCVVIDKSLETDSVQIVAEFRTEEEANDFLKQQKNKKKLTVVCFDFQGNN